MTTLVVTNINEYLQSHGGFNLDILHEWSMLCGFNVFVRVLDRTPINHFKYKNFYFSGVNHPESVTKYELLDACRKFKPTRIVNLLENFFPFQLLEDYDAEKIYFVRSCAKKLRSVLSNYDDGSDAYDAVMQKYKDYAEYEEYLIGMSDRVITDSLNSKKAINEMYGIEDVDICLEFIDPSKYNKFYEPSDIMTSDVFNIGRRDFQKGLHLIKPPMRNFYSIGKAEITQYDCVTKNITMLPVMTTEEYFDVVRYCALGIYPSIWESNGYAVQECLSMGKIPVIQKGSGGNELLCNNENSIIVDFDRGNFDWEGCIDSYSQEVSRMRESAYYTLTHEAYTKGRDRFLNIICS